MPRYTVAHSPDADDIFMYYAIRFGWVQEPGIVLENLGLDIETLNKEAIKGTYDATAISFGLYPKIRDDYALLRTAVSFGQGYGPKLVKPKGKRLRKNFKVALSGEHTTNALLFRIRYPEARPVYMNFLEIEEAVRSGTVHAGVLIHESILDYSDELETEAEVWDIWRELAGEELPLPLGGMALRRSLPLVRAIALERLLTEAVRVAVNNAPALGRMLLDRELVRVDADRLETYLKMYANTQSITMDATAYKALDALFKIGYDHGVYDAPIHAEDFLIPTEYEGMRN